MSKRLLFVLALAGTMGWVTPTVMADHGNGKDKGNHHANKHDDDDDQGWDRRDGYEYRVYRDHDGRPPGWNKGKKTGWGDCGMPPGQAKKHGCRSYVYEGRQHYYYRDDQGRIVVRRPIVEAHGSVVVR